MSEQVLEKLIKKVAKLPGLGRHVEINIFENQMFDQSN